MIRVIEQPSGRAPGHVLAIDHRAGDRQDMIRVIDQPSGRAPGHVLAIDHRAEVART